MDGWDVMAGPFVTVAQIALVVLVVWRLRAAVRRARAIQRRAGAVVRLDTRPSRRVTDTTIVSAYNDALLTGWPAGERATFDEVADRVGTSSDHVRTVIARHWAA